MLCIDVGNTNIYGGVFHRSEIYFRFRKKSIFYTPDEFGIFLTSVFTKNKYDIHMITSISICSVVPKLNNLLYLACIKYFSIKPFFIKSGMIKTGLNIKYKNPKKIGADRIANAIAAIDLFPNKNVIIIDFGTTITFCVINYKKYYLGGIILPGLQLSVTSLYKNTAQLPIVDKIIKVNKIIGNSTIEGIQSGIFYGTLGACKEIIYRIKQEQFLNKNVIVIATGGLASLFKNENIYDYLNLDLVLKGIRLATILNK